MSEREVPTARDDLACNKPTHNTAYWSASNSGEMGKHSAFKELNKEEGHSCKKCSHSLLAAAYTV